MNLIGILKNKMWKKIWFVIYPSEIELFQIPDPQKPGEYILSDHIIIAEPIEVDKTNDFPDYDTWLRLTGNIEK